MALQQVGGHRTPVEAELDLAIDAPGRVVAQNADDRQIVTHRGINSMALKPKAPSPVSITTRESG